jgi:hypothetical protein
MALLAESILCVCVCGTEDIINQGRLDEIINILCGIKRGDKWKTQLQSSKNGIIDIMCNVK